MKKGSSILKSTFIIMAVSLISRGLGFVRDILVTKNFNIGINTDAYSIAIGIPDTIFTLIGLAISTSFLPTLSRIRNEKSQKEMYKFANNIINILFIISIGVFILCFINTSYIVQIFASKNLQPETQTLAVFLTRITLINIMFLSVNACFTALLQINEDFVIPSILGLFFNFPMIVYLLLFRNFDITGLAVANVIGNFLRVAVQVPSLLSHNYKYQFIINFKDENVRKIIYLVIPVIIGAGANSINMVVDKNLAASLHRDGSISALEFSQKLVMFINNIITASVTSIIYPLMANRLNEGKMDEFITLLKKSVVYIFIFLMPIGIGISILGKDVVNAVYFMDENGISLTSSALIGYGIGIAFTAVRDILNSTLFSMGKTKVTAVNGIIGMVINVILSISLSKYIGIMGITIASSIAMAVTQFLLFISIIKVDKNIRLNDIIKKMVIIILNSIIMGIFVSAVYIFVKNHINTSLIRLIICFIAGVTVYFISSNIFKIAEIDEVVGIIKKKIRREV